jgi:CheY-like chemotaxis protein
MKILVVDDEEATVALITESLEQFGHTVYPAVSGQEALKILRARFVDVIVSDLSMPGVDGRKLSRIVQKACLKRKKERPRFILLTGLGGQLDREVLHREGIDAVLEKPVSIIKLTALVRGTASTRIGSAQPV